MVETATVSVRYIVNDIDAAIDFYCTQLGFRDMHPAPTFAMLSRGDLRLLLSAPSNDGGGGQTMPDGTRPEPGGWNRFSLEVSDLAGIVRVLSTTGSTFAMTSSPASEASRSWLTIRRAIPWSSSSRSFPRPVCRTDDGRPFLGHVSRFGLCD